MALPELGGLTRRALGMPRPVIAHPASIRSSIEPSSERTENDLRPDRHAIKALTPTPPKPCKPVWTIEGWSRCRATRPCLLSREDGAKATKLWRLVNRMGCSPAPMAIGSSMPVEGSPRPTPCVQSRCWDDGAGRRLPISAHPIVQPFSIPFLKLIFFFFLGVRG